MGTAVGPDGGYFGGINKQYASYRLEPQSSTVAAILAIASDLVRAISGILNRLVGGLDALMGKIVEI